MAKIHTHTKQIANKNQFWKMPNIILRLHCCKNDTSLITIFCWRCNNIYFWHYLVFPKKKARHKQHCLFNHFLLHILYVLSSWNSKNAWFTLDISLLQIDVVVTLQSLYSSSSFLGRKSGPVFGPLKTMDWSNLSYRHQPFFVLLFWLNLLKNKTCFHQLLFQCFITSKFLINKIFD